MTTGDFDLKGPADFINHIYSVAIDPERMGELVDSWEKQLGHSVAGSSNVAGATSDAVVAALDRVISAHAQRLSELLANFRTAAFIINLQGLIVAANDAATAAFDVMPGHRLTDLPIADMGLEELSLLCSTLFEQGGQGERVSRFQIDGTRHTVLAHLRLVEQPDAGRHIIIVTSEQPWTDGISQLLAQQFSITSQEAFVLQGIARGETVKDLSDLTGRSAGTIRTHIHALLDKTGLKSQAELVRLAMTLLHSTASTVTPSLGISNREPLYTLNAFTLADGRTIYYRIAGSKNGRPFLLLPSGQGFIRWTDKAEADMERRGLKMIAMVRAGYGPSSPPPSANIYDTAADDAAQLLAAEGAGSCPVLAICDDIKIAHHLARRHPGLVTHIIGAAATMPLQNKQQYARLGKFVRFVQMNASYAPRTLPYVSLLFFHMARRLGNRRFLETMMADSPADVAALQVDEIAAPLIAGTETILTPHFMAHSVWSKEIIEFAKPWAEQMLGSNLPLTLFNGTTDPFSPIETVREYAGQKTSIKLVEVPDAGQTLVYTHHALVLDELEQVCGG